MDSKQQRVLLEVAKTHQNTRGFLVTLGIQTNSWHSSAGGRLTTRVDKLANQVSCKSERTVPLLPAE